MDNQADQAAIEMPKYQSHKQVHALEIESCDRTPMTTGDYTLTFVDSQYAPRVVSPEVVSRHMPEKGDFFVVYEDGYESISPRKPFVEGYTSKAAVGAEPAARREIRDHKVGEVNDGITITVHDEPGAGGANHLYMVRGFDTSTNKSDPFVARHGGPAKHATILFQNGGLKEAGINGVTHEILLAVVIDRLRSFQAGPFPNAHNQVALAACQEALGALKARTVERQARGVEGRSVA